MILPLLSSGLVRQGALSLGIKIASVVLGLVVSVLLARLLGPKGYGQYTFVFSILLLLSIPAQLGLPQLVVRETARTEHEHDWGRMRGLWLWAHLGALALSALIFCAMLVGFGLWATGSDIRLVALFGALLVPLLALGEIRGGALRGLGRVILGQLPDRIVRPLVLLVLIGATAVLARDALSPQLAMALHVVAGAVAFAVGTAFLVRATPPDLRAARRRSTPRAWAMSALPLGLIAGLLAINQNFDLVMLGFLRTDEEVAVYKVAVTGAALVILGLESINVLIMPRVVRAHAAGEREALQDLVTSAARLVFLFAAGVALLYVVAGGWLLETAFGPAYRNSYPVLLVLTLAQLVNAWVGLAGTLLNMTGHERDTLLIAVVATATNIALNLVLIPLYGTLGAAVASALAIAIWKLLLWWRVWKRLGMNSTAFRIRLPRLVP